MFTLDASNIPIIEYIKKNYLIYLPGIELYVLKNFYEELMKKIVGYSQKEKEKIVEEKLYSVAQYEKSYPKLEQDYPMIFGRLNDNMPGGSLANILSKQKQDLKPLKKTSISRHDNEETDDFNVNNESVEKNKEEMDQD